MIECAVTLFLVIQACSLHYCFAQALPYKVVLGCWRVFGAALCYKVVLGSTLKMDARRKRCREKDMRMKIHLKTKEMSRQKVPQGKAVSTERSLKEKTCENKGIQEKMCQEKMSREGLKKNICQKIGMPSERDANGTRLKRHRCQ